MFLAVLNASGIEILNARLSVLRGPTHITPHCGMSNAKLRAHIGLRVPLPSPADDSGVRRSKRNGIRVGNDAREWVEGEALLFDDSFEHEVWWRSSSGNGNDDGNDDETDESGDEEEERVVLIVDVFHPELPAEERADIRAQMVAQHDEDDGEADDGKGHDNPDADSSNSVGSSRIDPVAARSDGAGGGSWVLAGGYRVGDRVRTLVAQSDRTDLQVCVCHLVPSLHINRHFHVEACKVDLSPRHALDSCSSTTIVHDCFDVFC